jgi:hypothetical protein
LPCVVRLPLTGAYSDGAANLNDMKDMLANLPQYQEQREKVYQASSVQN